MKYFAVYLYEKYHYLQHREASYIAQLKLYCKAPFKRLKCNKTIFTSSRLREMLLKLYVTIIVAEKPS